MDALTGSPQVKGLMVRRLTTGDMESLLAIQQSSPEAAQWSLADFERVAQGDFAGWVAELSGRVVGFVVARRVADEIEILNLAVEPAARRSGMGSVLLREALRFGGACGARRAFLEVRRSNRGAQIFYQRHGFSPWGCRANYYTQPREDALVLTRPLESREQGTGN